MITLNLHNICQVPALLFKIISQTQDWRHIRAARTRKNCLPQRLDENAPNYYLISEGWISIMFAIIQLVDSLISLYLWCLFIFVILTWLIHFGVVNTQNRLVYLVVDFLYKITDPVLRPIRNILPNLGGIDISPIILVLALIFIRNLIVVDLAKLM